MVKLYTKDDYDEIAAWWHSYGSHLDKDATPRMGFIGCVEDVSAFSAFVAQDPSCRLGWFCFPCANPAVRGLKRNQAINEVILAAQAYAKLEKISLVAFVHSSPMVDRLKSHGFWEGDPKPVNLLWQPS